MTNIIPLRSDLQMLFNSIVKNIKELRRLTRKDLWDTESELHDTTIRTIERLNRHMDSPLNDKLNLLAEERDWLVVALRKLTEAEDACRKGMESFK